jgi:hypothetical protein
MGFCAKTKDGTIKMANSRKIKVLNVLFIEASFHSNDDVAYYFTFNPFVKIEKGRFLKSPEISDYTDFKKSDSTNLAYLPTEMKPVCLTNFPSLTMKMRDSMLGRWSRAVKVRGGRRPPTMKFLKLSKAIFTLSRENPCSGSDLPKASAITLIVTHPST